MKKLFFIACSSFCFSLLLHAQVPGDIENIRFEYMDKSISFFDGGAEGFYHGLMLGLIALMDNQYKIKSNRESGDGRFDVSLIPREKRYPGIILELKWKEKLSDVELEKWSNEALKQIGELRYDSEMKEDGITEILKFGIAFSGKKVCVRTE